MLQDIPELFSYQKIKYEMVRGAFIQFWRWHLARRIIIRKLLFTVDCQ